MIEECWRVITDTNQYRVSKSDLDLILAAERKGDRFVRLERLVLNVDYIKEIKREGISDDLRSSCKNIEESNKFGPDFL